MELQAGSNYARNQVVRSPTVSSEDDDFRATIHSVYSGSRPVPHGPTETASLLAADGQNLESAQSHHHERLYSYTSGPEEWNSSTAATFESGPDQVEAVGFVEPTYPHTAAAYGTHLPSRLGNVSGSSHSSPASDNCSTLGFLPDGVSPKDLQYARSEWRPSATQLSQGHRLYFERVSPFVPFLHQPTFDATQIQPCLNIAILAVAYQHGEDPDRADEVGTGSELSHSCFHRARVLATIAEDTASGESQHIEIVQTYWLLQVCANLYMCGETSPYGLAIHSRMVALARAGGLTQSITQLSTPAEDLEALWRAFIRTETHKRTVLAIHQIDALWYQLLSIPRALSHLEIKHDLPCPEEDWAASSAALWAHRKLVVKKTTPPMQYIDAVRLLLSPNPDLLSLSSFDLYGAININQFLISSAREMSGWSMMTGRISVERAEPLKSSLLAIHDLTVSQQQTANPTTALTCEATWQMAMIELQLWSPSHTCGFVETSLNGFLSHSTVLASCSKPWSDLNNAAEIQPHLDWFLKYIGATDLPVSEPPWLLLYAYKAFLVTWQLACSGWQGAMSVVGIPDGDLTAALDWAKGSFRRRCGHRLGVLTLACLDSLSDVR